MVELKATVREGRRGRAADVMLVATHCAGARHYKSLASSPPLGLIMLGTVLRREGIAAEVMNLSAVADREAALFEFARGLRRLRRAGVVGISMNMTALRGGAYDLIRAARELRPDAKIVLGGTHATNVYGSLMKNFPVDCVMLGEAESSVAEVAAALLNGDDIGEIGGVAARDNYGEKVGARVVDTLGSLPLPDYGIVNLEIQKGLYARRIGEYDLREMKLEDGLPVESSRGCPFSCGFCGIGRRRLRMFPVGYVCENIAGLHREHGFTAFTFVDDIFTYSRERTMELCGALGEMGLPITWAAQTRADYVDYELLLAMKEAGCRVAAFGVESGSEAIQKSMGKRLEMEKAREAVKNARRAGLAAQTFFLLGHPGETGEDVKKTAAAVRSLRPEHFCVDAVKVFPGAAVYDELKGRNLISDEFWIRDASATPTYSGLTGREVDEKEILEVEYAWLESADMRPERALREFLGERFSVGEEIFEGCFLRRFFRGREGNDHVVVEWRGDRAALSVSYKINDNGSLDVFAGREPFLEYENLNRVEMAAGRLNDVFAAKKRRYLMNAGLI